MFQIHNKKLISLELEGGKIMNRKFVLLWLPTFTAFTAVLAVCAICRGEVQYPAEWAAKLFVTALAAAWVAS